ncbi:hypothetical protein ACQPU1_16910 [Clostridium paraputrificum]|uniref:hypothetical protein n=1 Tax=Clostridium paraputrificum TaxID=29363 RepID=UPI003D32EA85
MNIFDAGGLTTFIAVIITLAVGTGIFILLHNIFEIVHFGFGAMITMWVVCCIVGAFIVNFLGGLVGGIFSILWFLIRLALIIGVISYIGYYLYNKLKGKKE